MAGNSPLNVNFSISAVREAASAKSAAAEWLDWKWQLRNLIRTPAQIAALLREPPENVKRYRDIARVYRFSVWRPALVAPLFDSFPVIYG